MKISLLSSGSKGNSSLIENDELGILIDAGLSGKKALERIVAVNGNTEKIAAIIITHDHSDHIKGAGILARKLKIPIYIHEKNYHNSNHLFDKCQIFYIDKPFRIGSFCITPIPISHDGTENFAYNIVCGDKKISHITDLGVVTNLVRAKIQDTDLLLIESNHDPKMLKEGPYPWNLKQRIKGKQGHLSNKDACDLVMNIAHPKLKNVILAHLSDENNDPKIAFEMMNKIKIENNLKFELFVGRQDKALPFIEV